MGALAESLEHFVLDHHASQNLVASAINDIRNQPLLNMDGLLTNLPKSSENIDCVEMTDMKGGSMAIIPAVLQIPNKSLTDNINTRPGLSFLNRYSTNSGTAFGCSADEAILHGLNEIIERHTLSKILMSLCGQHERLMLTSPSTYMMDEIFSGQSEFRSLVEGMKILITKTIYGVYFSMAIPKRPDGRYPICPIGSGCSLDAHIAIERAATELLQTLDLFDESEKANDLKACALMQRSFALQPLINLEMLRNIGYTSTRLDPPMRTGVAEQIDYIIEKVAATGLHTFSRTLFTFENGCAVTQINIPGLERFNLVRAGIPVIPQHLLHANRSLP